MVFNTWSKTKNINDVGNDLSCGGLFISEYKIVSTLSTSPL